jgi:hypothetical protein
MTRRARRTHAAGFKAKGSSRDVGQEGVPLPIGTHHIEGSIITISGPPGMEPAIAYRPTYSFTIGGAERKVTEACVVSQTTSGRPRTPSVAAALGRQCDSCGNRARTHGYGAT